jgi:enoyl-CoA hydratase
MRQPAVGNTRRMVRHESMDNVEVITLDRPERRNALDRDHCDQLRAAIEDAVTAERRAVVITGAGTSFCSGADFGEVYSEGFRDALYAALSAIQNAPMPVIAAINGPAIGAGTQVALACDLRVASDAAVFAIPTARIGLAVDPWTIRRLASLTGASAAAAVLLGVDEIDASGAHRLGLVNRTGDLDAATEWARSIAAMAPLTLEYSKRVLNQLAPSAVDAELAEAFERCWSSDDLAEGQLARKERRAPQFRGF